MTDPRMTPTNDAPVTVEQCDREAAARERTAKYEGYGFKAESLETPAEMRRGHRDWDPLVQKHARHRLAALASAPAGDGVEEVADLMADAHLGAHYDDLDSIDRSAWHHFRAGVLAALARPRSAVAPAEEGVEDWGESLLPLTSDRIEAPRRIATELRRIANVFAEGFKMPPFLRDAADEIDRIADERDAALARPPAAVGERPKPEPQAWGDIECSGCTLPRRDCECN